MLDIGKISASFILCFLFAVPINAQELASRADNYLSAYEEKNDFAGTVLIAQKGEVIFKKGYGMADASWNRPNTTKTKFNIASLTKQFTGMAVLQLAAKGKLDIDEPVTTYYKGAPEAWKDITIYHLLNHMSGLPKLKSLDVFKKGLAQPYSSKEMIATFQDIPLDSEPGSEWAYSNRGYYLLGYLIELVSGLSYGEYLDKHIFGPAGMNDSGFDTRLKIIERHAEGYTIQNGDIQYAQYVDWSLPYAAGGIYSTVEDLFTWDQALYSDKLLNKEWRNRLFTPDSSGYNYGWYIETEKGRKKIYHSGHNPGFSTFLVRYPEEKTFVVVLSNLDTIAARKIGEDLAALSFGQTISQNSEK